MRDKDERGQGSCRAFEQAVPCTRVMHTLNSWTNTNHRQVRHLWDIQVDVFSRSLQTQVWTYVRVGGKYLGVIHIALIIGKK